MMRDEAQRSIRTFYEAVKAPEGVKPDRHMEGPPMDEGAPEGTPSSIGGNDGLANVV